MKDHAHYNVDTGTLELSTRYKTIKNRQLKEPIQIKKIRVGAPLMQ